jgi:hypothetical protein
MHTLEIHAGKLDHVGEDPHASATGIWRRNRPSGRKMELHLPMVTTPGRLQTKSKINLRRGFRRMAPT